MEARQLAAGGDLAERSAAHARIGRDLEHHALAAMLAPVGVVPAASRRVAKRALSSFSGGSSVLTAVSRRRAALARALPSASAAVA